ncbi:hypothetical protein DACRYDRAFT_17933 [Dacryopinax primogenitus]|uniref:Uncharacterized protein n=1 Tax=Dacryopinax primogenitus (strain DJM 731) TaxID=1858805 RepID=M5FPT7_DACPD|nr:uncharacterized protein DACRYDRAFT_17933 [Dacryopinax primogenitus]EJT98770.1 hypothetical protein DACRYDRAFT_17933 [Dacryopinax primogenitus]
MHHDEIETALSCTMQLFKKMGSPGNAMPQRELHKRAEQFFTKGVQEPHEGGITTEGTLSDALFQILLGNEDLYEGDVNVVDINNDCAEHQDCHCMHPVKRARDVPEEEESGTTTPTCSRWDTSKEKDWSGDG